MPIYDEHGNVIGVLSASLDGLYLTDMIKDIVVGKTGYCYLLGLTGTTIAFRDTDLVLKQKNSSDEAKADSRLKSNADFEKRAVEATKSAV